MLKTQQITADLNDKLKSDSGFRCWEDEGLKVTVNFWWTDFFFFHHKDAKNVTSLVEARLKSVSNDNDNAETNQKYQHDPDLMKTRRTGRSVGFQTGRIFCSAFFGNVTFPNYLSKINFRRFRWCEKQTVQILKDTNDYFYSPQNVDLKELFTLSTHSRAGALTLLA